LGVKKGKKGLRKPHQRVDFHGSKRLTRGVIIQVQKGRRGKPKVMKKEEV